MTLTELWQPLFCWELFLFPTDKWAGTYVEQPSTTFGLSFFKLLSWQETPEEGRMTFLSLWFVLRFRELCGLVFWFGETAMQWRMGGGAEKARTLMTLPALVAGLVGHTWTSLRLRKSSPLLHSPYILNLRYTPSPLAVARIHHRAAETLLGYFLGGQGTIFDFWEGRKNTQNWKKNIFLFYIDVKISFYLSGCFFYF